MLQNLIMSGRIGKWAYALIEYDLTYEPLKSMKGQVVADFIVEHRINDTHELDMSYLTITPWTLYFDGSVCNEGQGIGIVLVSPSNVSFDFDFIVEHRINDTHELDMSYLTITPWTLYFDGSVCNEGQGIGIVLVSPSNVSFDFSSRLKTYCTNNQAEYEALLFGLELLNCMGVKHVKAFGDSQLVVQQVLEVYQCFDGTLNSYLENVGA